MFPERKKRSTLRWWILSQAILRARVSGGFSSGPGGLRLSERDDLRLLGIYDLGAPDWLSLKCMTLDLRW